MKKIMTLMMVFCIGVMSVSAQSEQEEIAHKHGQKELHKEFRQSLSPDQQAQFKKIMELRKDHKKSLKATFTDAQKKISENKEISRKERHEAIKASYTSEQKSMIAAHKEALKNERETFKATLNEKQLEQFASLNKKRMGKGKGAKRKK